MLRLYAAHCFAERNRDCRTKKNIYKIERNPIWNEIYILYMLSLLQQPRLF